MTDQQPTQSPIAAFAAHREQLVRFCHRYLGRLDDAEDVVQELGAMLADRAASPDEPRPWMFRVARNLCLNALRKRKGASPALGTAFPGSRIESPRTGPPTAAARSERDVAIQEALADMPRHLAEVLDLRYFGNLGRRESAEVLGCTENQVKVWLTQAREELARKLGRADSEPGEPS